MSGTAKCSSVGRVSSEICAASRLLLLLKPRRWLFVLVVRGRRFGWPACCCGEADNWVRTDGLTTGDASSCHILFIESKWKELNLEGGMSERDLLHLVAALSGMFTVDDWCRRITCMILVAGKNTWVKSWAQTGLQFTWASSCWCWCRWVSW